MTLDEAIKHCEEKAKELRKQYELYDHWDEEEEERANGCLACAEEHEQLAEWLRDYKRLLTERPIGEWVKNHKSFWDLGNCSECGYLFVGIRDANYCPNCGADMREGEGE